MAVVFAAMISPGIASAEPGYDRSCKEGHACSFGPAWNDPTEHSGCDTRNRVLAAQLSDVTFRNSRDCKVLSGVLHDPYSGTDIDFTGGSSVEIDHIYPLARAWNAGAWQWPLPEREAYANDMQELLAVSGPLNVAKGDAGLDRWLPPNQGFRCEYVTLYLGIAAKYDLPITAAEYRVAAHAC